MAFSIYKYVENELLIKITPLNNYLIFSTTWKPFNNYYKELRYSTAVIQNNNCKYVVLS